MKILLQTGLSFLFLGCVQCYRFCQPDDECWPTQNEIRDFVNSLSPPDAFCLGPFFSKDEPGPMIDNLWYPEAPDQVTPYQLGNFRNKITDNVAYFVVVPKNQEDVVKAVKFATSHNIGISVFGTGHEFNDRNAGVEPNNLLIRYNKSHTGPQQCF